MPAPDAPQPIRTFDELLEELHVTPAERAALVWHLAGLRARRTVEALLTPQPPFDLSFVLRGPG